MAKEPEPLPVDPSRLRERFPGLTEEDVAAYVEITRRILEAATPEERSRVTRTVMQSGKAARDKVGQGAALTSGEATSLRYLTAINKMQGRTSS